MKKTVQRAFHLFGLDLKWHVRHPAHDLFELLTLYEVDTVFDIGANSGMSGEYFRNLGFAGKIVSFEPVSHYYHELEEKTRKDPLWSCENIALGDLEVEQEINVAAGASSFLNSNGRMEKVAPELRVVGREKVKIKTLQSLTEKYYAEGHRLFLKIDAQGYEKNIVEGAGDQLDKVVGMRIEMSIIRNYDGEPLIGDMLPYLYDLGYQLCAIEEAWSNRTTQEVYQVDAVMFRTDRLPGKA